MNADAIAKMFKYWITKRPTKTKETNEKQTEAYDIQYSKKQRGKNTTILYIYTLFSQ